MRSSSIYLQLKGEKRHELELRFWTNQSRFFLSKRISFFLAYFLISWFATLWQGGHVGGQYNRTFSRIIYMKIKFSSQRREMLLFLTTNMAAVTSRANQQYMVLQYPTCCITIQRKQHSWQGCLKRSFKKHWSEKHLWRKLYAFANSPFQTLMNTSSQMLATSHAPLWCKTRPLNSCEYKINWRAIILASNTNFLKLKSTHQKPVIQGKQNYEEFSPGSDSVNHHLDSHGHASRSRF